MNNDKRYLLTESLINTIVLYIFLKKITTPFEEWEAYKLGLIDSNGKILKKPSNSKEFAVWDILTRFCRKFKMLLQKFIGKTKLAMFLTAAWLLKDSINMNFVTLNESKLFENFLQDFNYKKQKIIFEIIKKLENEKIETINENNFEFYLTKYIPVFDKLIEENPEIKEIF